MYVPWNILEIMWLEMPSDIFWGQPRQEKKGNFGQFVYQFYANFALFTNTVTVITKSVVQ